MTICKAKITLLFGLGLMAATGSALAAQVPVPIGPVTVSPDGDHRNVTVYHGDLNLASPADQKTLKARIRSASRRVCAFRDMPDYGLVRECQHIAAVNVQPQMLAAIDRANIKLADAGIPDGAY